MHLGFWRIVGIILWTSFHRTYVCDVLHDLVSFVCSFTKSNTPPWMFFTFFKLCKWYQIAQRISCRVSLKQLITCYFMCFSKTFYYLTGLYFNILAKYFKWNHCLGNQLIPIFVSRLNYIGGQASILILFHVLQSTKMN